MSTAPTDGPTDTNTGDVINKIIFPGEPTRPPIQFIRDLPIPVFSKGLYYTNPGLLHQAVIPITNDRDQLMRVWCLDFLQAGTRKEVQYESWHSIETYRYNLQTRAIEDNRRKAGIVMQTDRGVIEKYQIVVAGQEFRVNQITPGPIRQLIEEHGQLVPDRWGGILRLPEVVLYENQVYGPWMQLHRIGINPLRIMVPQHILSQVWCRYRITNRGDKVSSMRLEIEGFIVKRDPGEKAKATMRTDVEQLLRSSAAPTFLIWTSSVTFQWDVSYPIVPSHFTTRWPVPVVCEKLPGCNLRPSEFASRRTAHDVFYKAGWGYQFDELKQCEEWLNNPFRRYHQNRIPTLITPAFDPVHFDLNIPGRRSNPGDPKGSENDVQRMMYTPSIANLVAKWEAREKVKEYQKQSTEEGERMDWSEPADQVEMMDWATASDPGQASNMTKKPPAKPRGKLSAKSLMLTAHGKYGDKRDTSGLMKNFMSSIDGIKKEEAAVLAKVTRAGIATATARNHDSIRRTVQKQFEDRPDIFSNNRPGDPLVITARLMLAGLSAGTIRGYMSSYDRLVVDAGGHPYEKTPAFTRVMTGLRNLAHNPAKKIATPSRTAYSLQSLMLVAGRGVDLLAAKGKWNEFRCKLYRCASYLLFFGRLRSGEALMKKNCEADVVAALMLSDVVFNRDREGNITHVTIWLRQAKFMEEVGAMVVVPRLKGKPYCPVKALLQYLPLRNSRFQDNNISNRMPLFMAQYLWKAGAARPDFSQPGFYTKPRFAKDTDEAIKELVADMPQVAALTASLRTHSLRAGLPTIMMRFKDVPESLKKSLGRWHSNSSEIYRRNLQIGNMTSFFLQRALVIAAETGPGDDDQYRLAEE